MDDVQVDIAFEPNKIGSTKGLLIVQQGNKVLHSDRIDIAKAKDRTAFLNKLKKLCLSIDTDTLRESMLEEVKKASAEKVKPDSESPTELDISRIVRPSLFHVPEVSGLLIPVARLNEENEVEGGWMLCIQWADGRRQYLNLGEYLELNDDLKLWFHPIPWPPLPNTLPRWSREGRAKWLDGYVPQIELIFKRLCERFAYFLEFPIDEAIGVTATLALWTILTYVYPIFSAVPYLSIGGPLGSGKSRIYEVLSLVILNPLHSSNLTAPCLFRTLHAQGGILLLDEAERLRDKTPDAGEIRSVLLSGYKRGAQAHRLEKVKDSFVPVAFDVYGPKAIAGISGLPAALASRCVKIMMFRAGKHSPKPKRRIDPNAKIWSDLRDDLHAMALTMGASFIRIAAWQSPCKDLNGRDLEVWQPLLAMAKLVEEAGATGLLEIVEKHALRCIQSVNEDVVPESDEILLRLLSGKVEDSQQGITAGELLIAAVNDAPAVFSRYSARGVSAILNRYGIKSHRSGGKRYFCPTHSQWQAIEESYEIDLGFTKPDGETTDND